MNKIIILGIIAAVVIASVVAYSAFSIGKPWQSLSCDQMIELAMSPDHRSFTEQQHIEFHKDLAKCMEGKTHPMN